MTRLTATREDIQRLAAAFIRAGVNADRAAAAALVELEQRGFSVPDRPAWERLPTGPRLVA